jgi:hypothetical protein
LTQSLLAYIKKHLFFIGILCVGILVRFIPLNVYQFSHDELSALSRSIFPDLKQTLQYGVQYTDTHPPLVQLFLYYWIKVCGLSEIAIKIPFLLCGLFTVIAGYNFSKKWFGINAGLLASVFLSCSFIFCLYSTYARMYITGVLFSIGCLHFLFNIIYAEKSKKQDFLYFGLCCLLCGYNNHLNTLFAFTCAISGLLLISPQNRKTYVTTCLCVLICYLPILQMTLTQLQMGGLGAKEGGWLPPPKPSVIFEFIKTLLGTGFAGILNSFLLAVLVIFALIKRWSVTSKQLVLLMLFAVNFLIIYIYSVYKSPVLQFSVLLFSGIGLLFFLTSFAYALSKRHTYLFASLITTSLLCQLIFFKSWFGDFQKHGFDMMTRESYRQIQKHGQQKVTSIFNAENYFIVHYLLKHRKPMDYKLSTDSVLNTVTNFRKYLSGLTSTHLVLGNFSALDIEIAKEFFPYTEQVSDSYFFNTITLCKDISSEKKDSGHVIRSYNVLKTRAPFVLETKLKVQQGHYLINGASRKFPFAFKTNFKNLNSKEGQWLLVKIKFREDSLHPLKNDMLCISINSNKGSTNYFTSAHFSDYRFSKDSNYLYCQAFIGTEIDEWNKSGELKVFIWKKDKASLIIDDFVISLVNYVPLRFDIWK